LDRLVLDTNVIVSGIISPKGAPSKILDLFFQGKVNLFFNMDMLTEIERVLSYPKIGKKYCISEEEISGILGILVRYGMLVIERGREEIIEENHSDDMFLSCARHCEADYIISGDRHLLRLKSYLGIPIVTPATYINKLRG